MASGSKPLQYDVMTEEELLDLSEMIGSFRRRSIDVVTPPPIRLVSPQPPPVYHVQPPQVLFSNNFAPCSSSSFVTTTTPVAHVAPVMLVAATSTITSSTISKSPLNFVAEDIGIGLNSPAFLEQQVNLLTEENERLKRDLIDTRVNLSVANEKLEKVLQEKRDLSRLAQTKDAEVSCLKLQLSKERNVILERDVKLRNLTTSLRIYQKTLNSPALRSWRPTVSASSVEVEVALNLLTVKFQTQLNKHLQKQSLLKSELCLLKNKLRHLLQKRSKVTRTTQTQRSLTMVKSKVAPPPKILEDPLAPEPPPQPQQTVDLNSNRDLNCDPGSDHGFSRMDGDLAFCICGKSFSSKLALNGHVQMTKYRRGFLKFSGPKNIIKGQSSTVTNSNNPNAKFRCAESECREKFTHFVSLKRHMKSKHRKWPYPEMALGCRKCGGVINSHGEYVEHLHKEHSTDDQHNPTPTGVLGQDNKTHGVERSPNANTGGRQHVCTCGTRYHSRGALHTHIHNMAPKDSKMFPCSSCGQRFDGTGRLRKHMWAAHKLTLVGSIGCRLCGKTFKTQTQLWSHRQNDHGVPKGSAVADPVTKKVTATAKVNVTVKKVTVVGNQSKSKKRENHAVARSTDQGHVCTCGATYLHLKTLKTHIFEKTTVGKFQCPKCAKKLHGAGLLKKHLRQAHKILTAPGSEVTGCRVCGKSFNNLMEFRRHRLTAHNSDATNDSKIEAGPSKAKSDFRTKISPKKAEIAIKTVTTVKRTPEPKTRSRPQVIEVVVSSDEEEDDDDDELEVEHSLIGTSVSAQTKSTVFLCSCGKEYSTKGQMTFHVRAMKNGKIFKCTEPKCAAAFYFHVKLKEHLKSKHKITPLETYGCTDCGKTFRTMRDLLGHRSKSHGSTSR